MQDPAVLVDEVVVPGTEGCDVGFERALSVVAAGDQSAERLRCTALISIG